MSEKGAIAYSRRQEALAQRQEVKLLLTLAFTPSLCLKECDYGYIIHLVSLSGHYMKSERINCHLVRSLVKCG
ncbi:MAG: hypothetical protein V7K47_15070 [Nostoc sp.]